MPSKESRSAIVSKSGHMTTDKYVKMRLKIRIAYLGRHADDIKVFALSLNFYSAQVYRLWRNSLARPIHRYFMPGQVALNASQSSFISP